MTLAALDWFIIAVLAGGLIRGFMVGAVRQVASLGGLILAFVLSVQLMHPVGAVVVSALGVSDAVGPLAGFVVIFVGVQLLFVAVSRLIERVLETLSLSLVNRAAGGALGGFKAVLLLSVLFLILGAMNVPSDQTRNQSVLYPPVAQALPKTLDAASPYLPAADRASETFGSRESAELRTPTQKTSGGQGRRRGEDESR